MSREKQYIDCTDMQAGDHVEFETDLQTDKGPSSGRVIGRNGDLVRIAHSDHPGELFNLRALRVLRKTTHRNGGTLWVAD